MLIDTIKFDKDSAYWTKDPMYVSAFILNQMCHFNNRLVFEGGVYLNEIYREFGIPWDYNRDNICIRKRSDVLGQIIDFQTEMSSDGSATIKIIDTTRE